MIRRNIKINIWFILLFILLLPSLLPTYLWRFGSIAIICKVIRYGSIFFIVSMYLFTRQRPSKILLLLILYVICLGISTQLSPTGDMNIYISSSISILSTIILCEWAMKKKPQNFIKSLLFMLENWIFINFITIVFFKDGLYQSGAYSSNYFLGYDNAHIRIQILALGVSYLNSFIENKNTSIRTIILYFIVLLSNISVFSVTAIIITLTWGIVMLYIRLSEKKAISKLLNLLTIKNSLIIGIILSLTLVSITSIPYISYLIEDVFHKDMTLSGRTYIWNNAILAIEQNPIWGYGYEPADIISMKLVNQTGFGTSPHNFYLEILYQGGVVLFFIILVLYFSINKELKKYKNSSLVYGINLWMLIIVIMGVVEPQLDINLIISWIIIYNINSIMKLREEISVSFCSNKGKGISDKKKYIIE